MRLPAMAALGIAAYAVFLLAGTPATFVAARAGAAASGQVELADTQGTLWSGSARARIRVTGGDVLLDRIEWRFLPTRLASGRIAFDVVAMGRGLDVRSQVARGFAGWELRDVAARGDAAALTPLAPVIATWRPEGNVAISSPAIEWNDSRARGDVRAEWNDAVLSISDVRPLGSYRIDVHADGGPANVVVATISGPLRIAAQGTLMPPSVLRLSGDARGEGATAGALEPLLNLIGPRRPDGARALEIRLN